VHGAKIGREAIHIPRPKFQSGPPWGPCPGLLVASAGGAIFKAFGAASAAEVELKKSAAMSVSAILVMVDLLCVVSGLAERKAAL